MKLLSHADLAFDELLKELARPTASLTPYRKAVRPLIEQVRREGDSALFRLTRRFDGIELTRIRVPRTHIESALGRPVSGLYQQPPPGSQQYPSVSPRDREPAFTGDRSSARGPLPEVNPSPEERRAVCSEWECPPGLNPVDAGHPGSVGGCCADRRLHPPGPGRATASGHSGGPVTFSVLARSTRSEELRPLQPSPTERKASRRCIKSQAPEMPTSWLPRQWLLRTHRGLLLTFWPGRAS